MWLVEQLPSVKGYPPRESERWFQGWSTFIPGHPLWYYRENAKVMTEREAKAVVEAIGVDLVRAVEVDDG